MLSNVNDGSNVQASFLTCGDDWNLISDSYIFTGYETIIMYWVFIQKQIDGMAATWWTSSEKGEKVVQSTEKVIVTIFSDFEDIWLTDFKDCNTTINIKKN